MRRWAFLLVLLGIASQAYAATRVSIDELEKLLASLHGQPDTRVAHELVQLELTERASSSRLAHWEAQFPGRHCHAALTELADAASWLELPASDIPALDAPAPDEQHAIISKASDYLSRTIDKLPNFYATRTTQHFEDTPPRTTVAQSGPPPTGRMMRGGALPELRQEQTDYQPIHPTSSTSVIVSYRNGSEVNAGENPENGMPSAPPRLLTTSGEFGPILGVILTDAMQGGLVWAHWEQEPEVMTAVFSYSVPKARSHYRLSLPRGRRNEQFEPTYHGVIAIDPATGKILRITVFADLPPPDEKVLAGIAVEYGTVEIGGKSYTCPLRSIAISKLPYGEDPGPTSPMQTQLNDVAFTGYHLFRTESRVITDPDVNGAPPASDPGK